MTRTHMPTQTQNMQRKWLGVIQTTITVRLLLYPWLLLQFLYSQHHNQVRHKSIRITLLLVGETEVDLREQNQQLYDYKSGRIPTPKAGYTKRLGGCVFEILSSALTSSESSLINLIFSSIRDGVTDLGMTELPRATVARAGHVSKTFLW